MSTADLRLGESDTAGGNRISSGTPLPVSDTTLALSSASFAITPNDSTDLAQIARVVYIGGDGDLTFMAENDTAARTLSGLTAGTAITWVRVKRVLATGTTATGLVGFA